MSIKRGDKMFTEFLMRNHDLSYKAFVEKLVPNIPKETIVGIRVPSLRKQVKLLTESEKEVFLSALPHWYYEENLMHAYLLNEIKDKSVLIKQLVIFLPYVDNWAVCDSLSPKYFKKDKALCLAFIKTCLEEKVVYTKRFGILCLMRHFLDEAFDESHLALVALLEGKDYYLKMAKAWYFAEAFCKQYEKTYRFFLKEMLDPWVYRKALQKALESQKISKEKKMEIKALRAKK